MKKALILVGAGLVVLVLGLVLVVPAVVDWNAYKPDIAQRLRQALGRDVEIAGDLKLSLVPAPALSAAGIRLGPAAERAAVDVRSIGALRLQLAPGPLFAGRIVMRELELVEPDLVVGPAAPAPAPNGGPPQAGAESGSGIAFGKIEIRDGRVTLVDQGATLSDVDAEVSAEGPRGPFRGHGALTWRGERYALEATVGDLAAASAPLSLILRQARTGTEAKLSGQLQERRQLRGRLAATSPDLRAALSPFGVAVPAAGTFALEGQVAATADRVALDQATLRLGDTAATGSAVLELGAQSRGTVKLALSSLDLDRLTAPAAPTAQPAAAPAGQPAPAKAFALPQGNLAVELTADHLVWRGAALRRARLDAALQEGRLQIGRLAALLPGGGDLTLAGVVSARDGRPALDGGFELAADSLRDLLTWLGADVSAVPADRLRMFAAHGKISGSPGEVTLRELDVSVDTSRIGGGLTLRTGERLGIGANLVADNVNLDAYLPPKRPPAQASGAAPPQPAPQPDPLHLLARFDANVKARLEQLTINETALREVILDGTLHNGDLTLRQVSAAAAGTTAELSGVVQGLTRGAPAAKGLEYRLRSRQPDKAFRLLGLDPPPGAERLGDVALVGKLDGDARTAKLDTTLETSGGAFTVAGTVADPFTAPRYDLDLQGKHPDLAQLIRVFSPDYVPGKRLGAMAFAAKLAGDAEAAAISDFRGDFGATELSGTGRLSFQGKPRLEAKLTAGDLDLDALLPAERRAEASPIVPVAATPAPARRQRPGWSREPLGLAWLRDLDADLAMDAQSLTWSGYRVRKAGLVLTVADGTLRVDRFAGQLLGGAMEMTSRLTAAGGFNADLRISGAQLGEAQLGTAGLEIASGTVDATAKLASEGRSMFEMVSRLGGQAELSARDGVVRGVNLGEVSQRLHRLDNLADVLALLQAGAGGSTPFSRLGGTFRITDGIVNTDDLTLEAEGGTGNGVATVNLPSETIDGRVVFRLTDHPKAPAFVMLLQGPLDSPRRSFDTRELQAWLLARGAGRLVDKSGTAGKIGKAIEDVLGQPKAGEQPAQPQQPAQPPSGRQLLEGLIKELGR